MFRDITQCFACGYEYNKRKLGTTFIGIDGDFKKEDSILKVKLHACPKCGTVKIEKLF